MSIDTRQDAQTEVLSGVPTHNEDPIDLTIVIPCLNEAENIVGILDSVKEAVGGKAFTTEIIVVDDKSDDETYSLASAWSEKNRDQFQVRVISRSLHRRGYGAVVRYGAAHGTGRY